MSRIPLILAACSLCLLFVGYSTYRVTFAPRIATLTCSDHVPVDSPWYHCYRHDPASLKTHEPRKTLWEALMSSPVEIALEDILVDPDFAAYVSLLSGVGVFGTCVDRYAETNA